MTYTAADFNNALSSLQHDMRGMQAKLTDIRRMVSTIPLPKEAPEHVCPRCGIAKPDELAVDLHLRDVHADPAAEQRIRDRDQAFLANVHGQETP